MRDPVAALLFVKDVGLLLRDCAADRRVSRRDKVLLLAVGAYLVAPRDLIPDTIPVLGQLDDLAAAAWGLRQLLRSAGPHVVGELWRGTDEGLALVLSAAGMQRGKDTV